MLPSEVAAGVAAILGEPVNVVEELSPPWATATRSALVGPRAAEMRFVVQWSASGRAADRRAMNRRLRLGRDVARLAPWLSVPEVIGGNGRGPTPFVVSRYVPGISGRDLLGDDAGAEIVGAAVGSAARGIALVPTANLRLSRTWSDPDRLGAAARLWLRATGPYLDALEANRVEGVIERLPESFAGVRPVFAHGDLAPVNVIIRDGTVAALLDLERARLAHPLFDAAWWRWIVRYHHPTRWPAAGGAFSSAAGIEQRADTLTQLNTLAVLQCLEMLASTPRGSSTVRGQWANRIVRALAWERDEPLAPPPTGG
jgi:aminoglycoside phosphotransferase (APT) family kinase protein